VHGLGLFLIIGVRLLVYWANKRTVASGGTVPAWRRNLGGVRLNAKILGFGLRVVILGVCVGLAGSNGSFVWLYVGVFLAWPQPLLSFVFIPLGVPYVAYHFTRALRPFAVVGEVRGGAVFNELRARLRWGLKLDRASTAPLAENLAEFGVARNDKAVRTASLAARAMFDVLEGDAEHARELFGVAQVMSSAHGSRSTRAYCQSFLLSDAARRGAYHEVVRLARRGPRTRRGVFLRGAALRILGATNAPRPWLLKGYFLLAPARRHTLSLLRLALAAEPRSELPIAGEGLAAARSAVFAVLRLPRGVVTRGELRRLACMWQAVFASGELRETFGARRMELEGTFDVDSLHARLERDIVQFLAESWRDSLADGDTDETEPPLVLAAKDQLQFELLGEIESLCAALPRGDSRTTDELCQHWRAWARVRALADLFFDVLPDRAALVAQNVGGTLLNHGAWLFNKEHARILAHDIFRFLYPLLPKDDPNRAAIKRNMRLSA
jgi:hypothetical protein